MTDTGRWTVVLLSSKHFHLNANCSEKWRVKRCRWSMVGERFYLVSRASVSPRCESCLQLESFVSRRNKFVGEVCPGEMVKTSSNCSIPPKYLLHLHTSSTRQQVMTKFLSRSKNHLGCHHRKTSQLVIVGRVIIYFVTNTQSLRRTSVDQTCKE